MDHAAEHQRIHQERKNETKAVKAAVIKAGYQHVRVKHGTGTACGWLDIHADQKPGQIWQETDRDLVRIVQSVTGRHGDYDGRINAHVVR